MPSPSKSIKDTGERMIPAYHKGHALYGEHLVRYKAAEELVRDKVILDIASGSGYGSALLAKTAKKVFGVDISKEAIEYSKKNYSSKKIEFIEGNGTEIPLADDAVDVVVTFETIEHIEDYETFMKEVKRVLKPDGLLILSTPNDIEFPESNHFHIHEFNKKELESLAKKYFKNIVPYYQGTWIYNALIDEKKLLSEWDESVYTMQSSPIKLEQCTYFYMLCSNRDVTESIEPLGAISEHFSERNKQEYEASIRKHMDEQAAIIKHLENAVNNKQDELNIAKAELKEIYSSKSMKAINKLRKLRR